MANRGQLRGQLGSEDHARSRSVPLVIHTMCWRGGSLEAAAMPLLVLLLLLLLPAWILGSELPARAARCSLSVVERTRLRHNHER